MSVITKAFGITVLCAVFLLPRPSNALVVSPMVTDLALDPGGSQTFSLVIGSDVQASTVSISLVSVEFGEDYSDLRFSPIGHLADWISMSETSFLMTENDIRQLEVTVSVPEQASPSSSPFAVLVSEAPSEGGVVVATSIAALVFLTIDPANVSPDAKLQTCTIDAQPDGSYDLRASITNTGQGILQPSGFIRVRNMLGFFIERHEFSLSERTPAGTTREYAWTIDGPSTFVGRLWNDFRGFRIGRLTMYCEIDGAMPAMTHAWVVPWGLFGVSAFVLGAGATTFILRRRAGK